MTLGQWHCPLSGLDHPVAQLDSHPILSISVHPRPIITASRDSYKRSCARNTTARTATAMVVEHPRHSSNSVPRMGALWILAPMRLILSMETPWSLNQASGITSLPNIKLIQPWVSTSTTPFLSSRFFISQSLFLSMVDPRLPRTAYAIRSLFHQQQNLASLVRRLKYPSVPQASKLASSRRLNLSAANMAIYLIRPSFGVLSQLASLSHGSSRALQRPFWAA